VAIHEILGVGLLGGGLLSWILYITFPLDGVKPRSIALACVLDAGMVGLGAAILWWH